MDKVVPPTDADFDEFRTLCTSDEGWGEVYKDSKYKVWTRKVRSTLTLRFQHPYSFLWLNTRCFSQRLSSDLYLRLLTSSLQSADSSINIVKARTHFADVNPSMSSLSPFSHATSLRWPLKACHPLWRCNC
jgi:hypothetical protein